MRIKLSEPSVRKTQIKLHLWTKVTWMVLFASSMISTGVILGSIPYQHCGSNHRKEQPDHYKDYDGKEG